MKKRLAIDTVYRLQHEVTLTSPKIGAGLTGVANLPRDERVTDGEAGNAAARVAPAGRGAVPGAQEPAFRGGANR